MNRGILKGITFVVTFIVSIVIISRFMNMGNTDMTAEMAPASLPIVSFVKDGNILNPMHGYTVKMEDAHVREAITPIGEDRRIEILIDTYGEKITEVAWEVRSVDGERLLENTELSELPKSGGKITLDFKIKDLIQAGEEYSLNLLLTLEDGRQARYYARIIQAEYELAPKLAFVQAFHEATFDRETLREYTKYLESNSSGDNSTLAKVNIHSSSNQIAWGGLDVKKESDVQIYIKEIANQTASFVLSYMVSYPYNQERESAVVEEYYRIRYTPDRIYLLDYQRKMAQLFDEKEDHFVNDKIVLGITDKEIEMKESEGGTVFAFENAGALYSYNGADNKLTRLFSFYDSVRDPRTLFDDHGYKILQVDEAGNVTFLVYGYMNRGRHEGECGVQVSFYSSTLNVVEELAFIPYTRSADILHADLENLAYVNGKNDLYLMLDGDICHVSLDDQRWERIAGSLHEKSYQVADGQSMMAWQKGDGIYSSSDLIFMNLNSGFAKEITAGDGIYIMPLGFMGEDLIYGLARKEDVGEDRLGYPVFPMYKIVIQDVTGKVLKNYEPGNVFVTDCSITDNQIMLTRVKWENGAYVEALSDQIMYNAEIEESKNRIDTAATENMGTIVQLKVKKAFEDKKIKILTPKEVLFEDNRQLDILDSKVEESPPRYYVYGSNGVERVLSDPADAVMLAYEHAGTVSGEDGSYIWKRDRIYTVNQIMAITGETVEQGESSLSVCLNSILTFHGQMRDCAALLENGMDAVEILEEGLEGHQILNLKGCSLDMVLYYPDRERPVLAVMKDGSAMLITGFNEQNVVLMNPLTGKVYKEGLNDAREMFDENGNNFIAYW